MRIAPLAAFAALAFSVAFPTVADADPIYACVQKSSEQVRIVPASEECRRDETRVFWNVQGAKGDPGPQGPKGDPGAPGPKGDPGVGLATGAVAGQAISCNGGLAAAFAYLPGQSFVALTASDGTFRLSYVPPGTYDVAIESMGGATARRSGVVVTAGATTSVGSLSVNDLSRDAANCGACGNACGAGQVCSNGQCSFNCVGGTTLCGNSCVNLASDPSNCGVCGNACGAGQSCVSGQCALTCAGGSTLCGGACVSLANDPSNCGACGNSCGASGVCINGVCTCGAGSVMCLTGCTNVSTDVNNCGACGAACAPGSTCISGACVAPTCAGSGACAGVPQSVGGTTVCVYPSSTTICSVSPLMTCNGAGSCGP